MIRSMTGFGQVDPVPDEILDPIAIVICFVAPESEPALYSPSTHSESDRCNVK